MSGGKNISKTLLQTTDRPLGESCEKVSPWCLCCPWDIVICKGPHAIMLWKNTGRHSTRQEDRSFLDIVPIVSQPPSYSLPDPPWSSVKSQSTESFLVSFSILQPEWIAGFLCVLFFVFLERKICKKTS